MLVRGYLACGRCRLCRLAPARASCAIFSIEQNMERSDVIFSGEVITIDPTRVFDRGFGWIGSDGVTFNVIEAWKGADTATVTLASPSHSEGYQFQQGQQYLVYAYYDGATLITDGCTGTKPLADAQGDLQILCPGSVPSQPAADEHSEAVSLPSIINTFTHFAKRNGLRYTSANVTEQRTLTQQGGRFVFWERSHCNGRQRTNNLFLPNLRQPASSGWALIPL